eukprot:Nitzschia sp. Nitz4//scaffold283_size24287//14810//15544//NITZ4_008406-RA/size24287-processed-gene-0.8-mRNA-1//-1//CDS//3329545657//5573//frame0
MAAATDAGKSKAIDVLLQDVKIKDEDDNDDKLTWPEEKRNPPVQNEEDLYGYGDGAPTPRAERSVPRRSSLKSMGPRRASIGYTGEMKLVLPSGKQQTRKTSISFKDDTDVQNIESVSDMVDDPNRLWFQKEEYAHIQKKIYTIVAQAKNGTEEERSTWLCTRGLEPLMDGSGAHERKEAYENVLEEQRVQKAQGRFDDEYLRTIYQFHSMDSQVVATERAARDAKSVEPYLMFTKKMCRRMSC